MDLIGWTKHNSYWSKQIKVIRFLELKEQDEACLAQIPVEYDLDLQIHWSVVYDCHVLYFLIHQDHQWVPLDQVLKVLGLDQPNSPFEWTISLTVPKLI